MTEEVLPEEFGPIKDIFAIDDQLGFVLYVKPEYISAHNEYYKLSKELNELETQDRDEERQVEIGGRMEELVAANPLINISSGKLEENIEDIVDYSRYAEHSLDTEIVTNNTQEFDEGFNKENEAMLSLTWDRKQFDKVEDMVKWIAFFVNAKDTTAFERLSPELEAQAVQKAKNELAYI